MGTAKKKKNGETLDFEHKKNVQATSQQGLKMMLGFIRSKHVWGHARNNT